MQVIYHGSVLTTFHSFGRLSLRKKFSLQYTVLLWYMGLRKKLNWHLISTENKYSPFWLQYYYDAWDLEKLISLDHHRKKYIFVLEYSATVMHRS